MLHSAVWSIADAGNSVFSSDSSTNAVNVWDYRSGQRLQKLEGSTDIPLCLRVLSPGQLASGGIDPLVRLWDVESGAHAARVPRIAVANERRVPASIAMTMQGHEKAVTSIGAAGAWPLREGHRSHTAHTQSG
jgi:WD40 repeat protein